MRRLLQKITARRPSGQSLVETAIFLPILVLLMAGVAEVANLLVTQNRVSTAARVATGFGASHYRIDYDWSQTDPGTGRPVWAQEMGETALNNVTETLDLDSQRWDIWTITGTLDVDPGTNQTSFDVWHAEHAYGDGVVVDPATEWPSLEPGVQNDVLDALNDITAATLSNDGLGIIATAAYHDRASLLGLNAFNFGPLTRVRGLTVMRIDEIEDNTALSGSCLLIPVAIQVDQYSLYPTNWWEPEWDGESEPKPRLFATDYPSDTVSLYPAEAGWQYPDEKKRDGGTYIEYTVPMTQSMQPSPANFPENLPGVPLQDAQIGSIYLARLEEGPGGFGWLDWDGPPFSGSDLDESLTYPGDFSQLYPGGPMDTDSAGRPYRTGDSDRLLEGSRNPAPDQDLGSYGEYGEYIFGSTGNINSNAVNEALEAYITRPETVVLMVVYDYTRDPGDGSIGGSGANMDFHVVGFALSRIVGYNFGSGKAVRGYGPTDRWIVFQFLGWADSCPAPTP